MRIQEVPARKGTGEKVGSFKKPKQKETKSPLKKNLKNYQSKIKSKPPSKKAKTKPNQPKHTSTLSALLKHTFFCMQIFLFHRFIDSE